MSQTRRSGFTLIELLAVMLLIITVMAMGVPAMFSAERKSYVNQAMNDLLRTHQNCIRIQRELAARGESLVVTIDIRSPTSAPSLEIGLSGNSSAYPDAASRVAYLELWMQRQKTGGTAFPQVSINADEFIQRVDQSNVTAANHWEYEPATGFIASTSLTDQTKPITLTFKALPSGANWKVSRDLHLYSQGYSEIP